VCHYLCNSSPVKCAVKLILGHVTTPTTPRDGMSATARNTNIQQNKGTKPSKGGAVQVQPQSGGFLSFYTDESPGLKVYAFYLVLSDDSQVSYCGLGHDYFFHRFCYFASYLG
jgi:hypothetical protein